MAKCLTCGTTNPDDNVYCAKCGTQLKGADQAASSAAYEEAQKQFEKDALIGMNKDKIVYTCLLCGAVNRIENDVCSKCGKKRPRNEYINALRRVQESRAAQEEYAAAQQKAAEEAAKKAEEAAKAAATVPEDPQQEKPVVLYKYVEEPRQLPQMVQPFVIVPYVNAEQPLWQYQPQQVYRFQPATYTERLACEQRANAAEKGEAPTEEELLRLREQVDSDLKKLESANPAKIRYNRNKKKVRAAAAFSFVFSVAAILLLFLFALAGSQPALKGYGYLKALGHCLDSAAGISLGFGPTEYVYNGAVSMVVPACVVLIMVFLLIIAIFSVIRFFTGRARVKGFVVPILAFVFALAAAITQLSVSGYGVNNLNAFFADATPAFYAMLGAPLVLMIIGFFCPKNIRYRQSSNDSKQK
jgi:ribosomal protein L40E